MSDCLVSLYFVSMFVVMDEQVSACELPKGLATLPKLAIMYYFMLKLFNSLVFYFLFSRTIMLYYLVLSTYLPIYIFV